MGIDTIDKAYAAHDAYLWEFLKAAGYDKVYNDQQLAALIDSVQKTRANMQTFERTLPIEAFVAVHISMLSTLVSFQSVHEDKYFIISALRKGIETIQNSIEKPPTA